MTAPSSHVCSTVEDESKYIIMHGTLLQSCSTDENESNDIIVNENLSQSCSMDKDELWSTGEDKSECAIRKQKDANNAVTYDVPNYFNAFNVFECRRNISGRLEVSYEKVCMTNPKEEYFTEMLDYLLEHNHRRSTPFSSKKLRESVIRVTEEEENIPNLTSITLIGIIFFIPPTLSMNKRNIQT